MSYGADLFQNLKTKSLMGRLDCPNGLSNKKKQNAAFERVTFSFLVPVPILRSSISKTLTKKIGVRDSLVSVAVALTIVIPISVSACFCLCLLLHWLLDTQLLLFLRYAWFYNKLCIARRKQVVSSNVAKESNMNDIARATAQYLCDDER
jgi:hypothetical protein